MNRPLEEEILSVCHQPAGQERASLLAAVTAAVACEEGGSHFAVRKISAIADAEERREILAVLACVIREENRGSYERLRIRKIRRI